VGVYGTSSVQQKSGAQDPSWTCRIDDTIIPSTAPFEFPENNWRLCNITGLPDSHHTLSITASSRGNPFWLDYILYTPSAGAAPKNALIKVEDSDSSIYYDSTWQRLPNFATMADTQGSTMEFNFAGTSRHFLVGSRAAHYSPFIQGLASQCMACTPRSVHIHHPWQATRSTEVPTQVLH